MDGISAYSLSLLFKANQVKKVIKIIRKSRFPIKSRIIYSVIEWNLVPNKFTILFLNFPKYFASLYLVHYFFNISLVFKI